MKKSYLLLPLIAILVVSVVYLDISRNSSKNSPSQNNEQQTASPTPSDSVSPTPTSSNTTASPTVTSTPAATPIPTPTRATSIKVTSEVVPAKIGTKSYAYSFVRCASSKCDHYLLPDTRVLDGTLLSTVPKSQVFPFVLDSGLINISATSSNRYYEIVTGRELSIGAVFEGSANNFGDGKTYYKFRATSKDKSVNVLYVFETSKATSSLKKLLTSSRKGKTAYINAKVDERTASNGTKFYNMMSEVSILFK